MRASQQRIGRNSPGHPPFRTLIVVILGWIVLAQAQPADLEASIQKRLSDDSFDFSGMAALFSKGKLITDELLTALDNPDGRVVVRAQMMLLLIGDDVGIQLLHNWYQQPRAILRRANGPVPTPLREWGYSTIEDMLRVHPSSNWRQNAVNLLFALAIDRSPRAKGLLKQMMEALPSRDDRTPVFRFSSYIKERPLEAAACEPGDPLSFVKRNGFFLLAVEKETSIIKLRGTTEAGQLDLLTVSQTFGYTFLVVLKRVHGCWRYKSVCLYTVNN